MLLRSGSADLLPGNEAPALRAGWHPVAAAGEVGQAPLTVLLQGRRHLLARGADGRVRCSGVRVQQRHGLVWLAPTDPDLQALELPEATDPAWCGGWLGPVRVGAPASAVLAAQLAGPGDGDLLLGRPVCGCPGSSPSTPTTTPVWPWDCARGRRHGGSR